MSIKIMLSLLDQLINTDLLLLIMHGPLGVTILDSCNIVFFFQYEDKNKRTFSKHLQPSGGVCVTPLFDVPGIPASRDSSLSR